MNKRMKGTKKGSVLIIAIIISLFISISALTIYTIVYRYTSSITIRVNDLREEVYDNGEINVNPSNGE